MSEGFYSKKSALGVPNALVLLMIVFFFVPFAFRGARMSLQKTENNVKDWLPSDFRETEELAWFAKRFVSEQFIIATWQGCHEEDQRFKLFVSKLRNEQAPTGDADPSSPYFLGRKLGAEYNLFVDEDLHFDWGGKQEKWLVDGDGQFYYITPNGRLYRWEGNANMVSAAWRSVSRALGAFKLNGQFIAAFGDPGTELKPNPFWQDPRLVTAPLFKTVETGPDMVLQLAGEDGSLHNSTNPEAGKRLAVQRLTGTMFGPPVPADFDWSSQAVENLLSADKLAEMPEDWQSIWDFVVRGTVEEDYEGSLESFQAEDPVVQSQVWYDFFDQVGVAEPARQTCVILTLTESARSNLSRVAGRGMMGQTKGRVFQIAQECGVSTPPNPTMAPPPFSLLASIPTPEEPVIHVGGPPIDNVAIDEEGTITLVRLIGYSVVLGLALSWILLRSIRLMLMVFFVGGVSAMASLGLVWWSNASVDAILLTMPSLVYVLGMAGAIHIVNYYRDATLEKGQTGAPERAISHAVVPCTLAAFTTAIGLLSLCSSNILPIKKFGIFSAMGVMATLVLLYTYLPSALTIFPPKAKTIKDAGNQAAAGILRFWEAIGAFILRRHWWVNAVCFTVFIGLGFGLFRIETSVQLLKLFDSNAQIIKDYGWLEENFGRLVPMELVVRFPKSLQEPLEADENTSIEDLRNARLQLSRIDRAEAVSIVQEVLQREFGYTGQDIVGHGMSPNTLLPDIPKPWAGYNVFRSGINRMLHKEGFEQLLNTDYLAVEGEGPAEGTELWRISLRLGALNDVDYGQFVSSIRAVVEPVVVAYRCRQEALATIVQKETSDDLIRGRVLVLGYHPRQNAKDIPEEIEDRSPSDPVRIFAETLQVCLVNKTVDRPRFHDPELTPLDNGVNRSEEWANHLKKFDCIIRLADHPTYDWDFVEQQGIPVIDAANLLSEALVVSNQDRMPGGRPVELSTRTGEMDVVYTGVVPVVYKAQRTLLVSLIESVAWAFVLIAGVMTCLLSPARSLTSGLNPRHFLRGFGSGMLSMIPNVFPVVVIFGFIGWSGQIFGESILVDIGTMMTASVAMGVAVDDTIHFLTWFREGLKRGLDRREAVFVAYKHVAPAMTQTTIIAGLGLSVFALSTFTPTQRFGTLMLALLAAALVGDLIFLPALLASPLGRVFAVLPKPSKDEVSGDSAEPGDSDDDDGEEYRLAESESPVELQSASESAQVGETSPVEEIPQLGAKRPQMMREPTKARRRKAT